MSVGIAPTVFADYFDQYDVRDGVVTCTGIRHIHGEQVETVYIAMRLSGLARTIASAMAAAQGMPADDIRAMRMLLS